MKIGVCVKQIPDTESRIRIKEDHHGIVEENFKYGFSPYDEYAIEEALRTKEKIADSKVMVISVGPKRVQETLRSALAMGCDSAIHIDTEHQVVLDSLVVAKLLAVYLKSENVELIFTGRQASDDDNAQTSQMIGEILQYPHVTTVSKFELDETQKKARVCREVERGEKQIWEVELPAVIAVTKGINEPRYASLKGIMQAKSKPLTCVNMKDVPLAHSELASKVLWSSYQLPQERAQGKLYQDDLQTSVSTVVRLLREEAKVL